jgi:hypothetical protein
MTRVSPKATAAASENQPKPPAWVAAAADLARSAHATQLDKSGQPYILHPTRVVGYLQTSRPYRRLDQDAKSVAQAAAWLHDVLEDTPYDRNAILAAGIPERVADVVELLTRRSQPTDDYYAAIKGNPIARAVKLADIEDNTDPDRLRRLDEPTRDRLSHKYLGALIALGVSLPLDTTQRRVLSRSGTSPRESIIVDATLGPDGLALAGDEIGPAINMLGGNQVEWWLTVRPHDLGRVLEMLEATPANLLDEFAIRFEREWLSRSGLLRALDSEHVRYVTWTWFTE